MVIDKELKIHSGIAMIELIFALVIMGIVLMSAPMLIQQSIQSGNVALQQEAIVAAASQTQIVLSMPWDENNTDAVGVSPILDVGRDPFDFSAIGGNEPLGERGGGGVITGRNFIAGIGQTATPTVVANLGMDITADPNTTEVNFNDFDDIDDYTGSDMNLTVFNGENTTADIGDYIDNNLSIRTLVNYTEDRVNPASAALLDTFIDANGNIALNNDINTTPFANPTNIKFINVNLTSNNNGVEELDKNITFQAFSCNIGTTVPQGATEL